MSRRSLLPSAVWRQRIKPWLEQYLGQTEFAGEAANPVIMSFLQRFYPDDTSDEIRPWCGIFMSCLVQDCMSNYPMPRLWDPNDNGGVGGYDYSTLARTWLRFNGYRVRLEDARQGDIVIFQRAALDQINAGSLEVHGHVALFGSFYLNRSSPYDNNFTFRGIRATGGNQGDGNPSETGSQGGVNNWGYKFRSDGQQTGIDFKRTLGGRLLGIIRMI